uniref:Uncharacterized protein n=1 Tax=Arundo donax TaxID=35708 RepID=A0A0A9RZS4_ARUDO
MSTWSGMLQPIKDSTSPCLVCCYAGAIFLILSTRSTRLFLTNSMISLDRAAKIMDSSMSLRAAEAIFSISESSELIDLSSNRFPSPSNTASLVHHFVHLIFR